MTSHRPIRRYRCAACRLCIAMLGLVWMIGLHALDPGFQITTVVKGLTESVYLAELPDGRMLVATKAGKLHLFDPRLANPPLTTYLELTDIDTDGERGLTSFALDPQFTSNGYLYVYYTHGTSQRNRVSRFTHAGSTVVPNSEYLVWQDPQPVKDCCHYGGGIAFGPDGKLYLATGEEFDGAQSADLTQGGGKLLRLNKDGSVPADNPFIDGPGGNLDEIWAYGLRNPYRAHWDLVGGRLYIGEVGGNINETAREDIHVGRAGANYGWPYCEGQCTDPQYDDPIFDYGHTTGGAVTLGVVYRGTRFPAAYRGALFFSDYVQQWVRYLRFNADGSVASVHTLGDFIGRIVHLIGGSDGALYFVDIRGQVKRIAYTAGNQPPVIQSLLFNATPGPAPASASFSVAAADPENDPLTYRWYLGDGTELTGASITHQYTQNGIYTARVEVSDGNNVTLSEAVDIRVGNPPAAMITQPADGLLFRAGQTIAFAGSGSDPDEALSGDNLSWTILFGHNTHTHPTLTDHVGPDGVFTINSSGHDYHSDTRYEVTLTVTDSDGLTATDSVTLHPEKVDLQLQTAPVAIGLLLDGIAVQTPLTYDTLIGFQHLVTAQSRCVGNIQYSFDSWSDGGAAQHTITVPDQDMTLTANFVATGSCSGLPESGKVLHLEADHGVTTGSEGLVQNWTDQSEQGNHLSGAGDPRLLPGALNGQPVIDFDGAGDKLERLTTLTGFPVGNTDRTVFLVANYRGPGYGGFAFGKNSCNQTFGTIVNPTGNLMLQAWCNDFPTTVAGTGAGWMVQSATLQSSQLRHYRDGALIDSQSRTFNTVLTRLVLGAEIDSNPYVNMQVAAAIVYNRALNSDEHSDVVSYLQQKYLNSPANQPPVAADDTATVTEGGSTVIDVLANDGDADGTLDRASVTVTTSPNHGAVTVDPATGAVTYTHDTLGSSDTFQYQVADDQGELSNIATVTIAISAPQNQPPQAMDDTATVAVGESVALSVLSNDSDPEGALDPASLVVTEQPAHGAVTIESTGEIVYTHTGSTAGSDSFQYRVADIEGLVSAPATVTLAIQAAPPAGELPAEGLVFHVEADGGVVTAPGSTTVTALTDRSSQNNDLAAAGNPQLVAGALNGFAVLDFDGDGDKLERTGNLNGFPVGAADRTLFLVARYRSAGYGGFGFGQPACNEMFGLSVNKEGRLMVQGWCRPTDFHSNTTGTGAGWLLQSAVVQSNALQHFRNGIQIDSRTNAFATAPTLLVLGAEIDSNPFIDMQIAAAVIYNRALTTAERAAVENYLRQKYNLY